MCWPTGKTRYQPVIISEIVVVATTSVATPAATTTLGSRLGFVHGESTSIMIAAIQCLDRRTCLVVVGHLNEAESSTTTGVTVDQGTSAELTEPNCANNSSSCSEVTLYLRFPT